MKHCAICEHRPATSNGFCHICADKIEAEERARKLQVPFRFIVYRDNVVGMFATEDGKYRGRLLKRSKRYLPKRETLNLNTYIPGFDRQQIKRLKRCVLSLAHA